MSGYGPPMPDHSPAPGAYGASSAASPSILAGLLLGLVAGVMAGVFGVGGGVILVPGLTMALGLGQHRAHATSLAAIILTAAAGTAGFAVQGSVVAGTAALVAVGAVAGALVGARVMSRIPATGLRIAFGVLLLAVAVELLLGGEPSSGSGSPAEPSGGLVAAAPLWSLVVGLSAGILSAVMGVGGGVILVPALVLLFGYSQQVAEGTSLAVIVPTALAGSLMHGRRGHTDWRTGLVVGAGGVVGALVGSRLAHGLDALTLQRLFGVLLVVVGGRLAVRTARDLRSPDRTADADVT